MLLLLGVMVQYSDRLTWLDELMTADGALKENLFSSLNKITSKDVILKALDNYLDFEVNCPDLVPFVHKYFH